jgi:hypothetical protein
MKDITGAEPANELTKFELISLNQMLAYRSNPEYAAHGASTLAQFAVTDAEALIKEINNQERLMK